MDGSALFVDASEQCTLIPVKLLGIDVAVVAFAEDLLDAFEFVGHVSEVLFVGVEDAFLDGLKFDGAQLLDACIEASGPCDGGASRLMPLARSSMNWSLVSLGCMG